MRSQVAHGARHDIAWLQRDFGLFVSNLFDTGVAAGLVGRPRGLGALYGEMLGLAADKKWQTADWRVRPLPRAALAYAREDTQFSTSDRTGRHKVRTRTYKIVCVTYNNMPHWAHGCAQRRTTPQPISLSSNRRA